MATCCSDERYPCTGLYRAMYLEHGQCFQWLLDHKLPGNDKKEDPDWDRQGHIDVTPRQNDDHSIGLVTYNATLLGHATATGRTFYLQALLKAGANPNIRDKFGLTPLHYATMKGYSACVRLLLNDSRTRHGVASNRNIPRDKFLTAAVEKRFMRRPGVNHVQIEEFMAQATFTPLHFATIYDQPLAMEILLEFGAQSSPAIPDGGYPSDFCFSLDTMAVLVAHELKTAIPRHYKKVLNKMDKRLIPRVMEWLGPAPVYDHIRRDLHMLAQ